MALIKQTTMTDLEKVQIQNTQCLQVMKMTAKRTFDLAWKNPVEFFAQVGTDGKKSIELHYQMQLMIAALDPSWVYLVPPYNYTIDDQTGIVTIGEKK